MTHLAFSYAFLLLYPLWIQAWILLKTTLHQTRMRKVCLDGVKACVCVAWNTLLDVTFLAAPSGKLVISMRER